MWSRKVCITTNPWQQQQTSHQPVEDQPLFDLSSLAEVYICHNNWKHPSNSQLGLNSLRQTRAPESVTQKIGNKEFQPSRTSVS